MASSLRTWAAQSPPVEWLAEWTANRLRDLALGTLRQGPVPQHIAFVMDGNRRYARTHKKEVVEGHSAGFETLARTLEICYKIGVKVVTVYAFSIENFKRTKYEVDALMDMAKLRLAQLAEHGELLQRYGARIQFLGKREMVRQDVLDAIDHAIEITKKNKRAVLNICAPYTSRDEMTMAMVKTVEQYCEPIRPRLKRPFSETHITRTIRAQRLSDAGAYEAEEGLRDSKEDARGEFAIVEEELYVPTSTDTKLALAKLTIFVTRILSQADGDGHDSDKFAMDNLAEAAANAVVHALKDPLPTAADKHHHVNEICGVAVSQAQLDDMLKLVDKLHDYVPPLDALASESTTLNTTGEHGNPSAGDDDGGAAPAAKYPDPEQITEASLTQHMYTGADLPPLELLVRTSGVERLHDFMLWQCHQTTEIAFVKCFWPDFGLIHLIPIILEYQWRKKRQSYWGEAVPGWTKID